MEKQGDSYELIVHTNLCAVAVGVYMLVEPNTGGRIKPRHKTLYSPRCVSTRPSPVPQQQDK